MPLIPITRYSPPLFLEGSTHKAPSRSDVSLAWQFQVLPAVKPRDTSKDPSADEVQAMDEFKRRKYDLVVAERQAKIPIATHQIKFDEIGFDSRGLDGSSIHHLYKAPFITDVPAHKNVFGKRCFRQVIDWDSDETFKKIKKDKVDKTFSMS
jgi:hypothetical protein